MAEIHKLTKKQRETWQKQPFFSFIFPILLSLLPHKFQHCSISGITGTYTDFVSRVLWLTATLISIWKSTWRLPGLMKGWCICSVYGMQCSKVGLWKGAIEDIREGYLYGQNLYFRRVRRWTAGGRGGASPYKTLLCTRQPPPPPPRSRRLWAIWDLDHATVQNNTYGWN